MNSAFKTIWILSSKRMNCALLGWGLCLLCCPCEPTLYTGVLWDEPEKSRSFIDFRLENDWIVSENDWIVQVVEGVNATYQMHLEIDCTADGAGMLVNHTGFWFGGTVSKYTGARDWDAENDEIQNKIILKLSVVSKYTHRDGRNWSEGFHVQCLLLKNHDFLLKNWWFPIEECWFYNKQVRRSRRAGCLARGGEAGILKWRIYIITDEFVIKTDEFVIKTDEFVINTDEFCSWNDRRTRSSRQYSLWYTTFGTGTTRIRLLRWRIGSVWAAYRL